jgi:solute carrier family 20 (sodium-dependent phosphate transporter)
MAAVFEFVGAMVLGRVSTNVIATGIADSAVFARDPEILAYGMVCAMTISGVWQVLASYLEFNVSSTHSIIGSIIGFALVYGGSTAVKWSVEDPASFPPYKVCCVLFVQPLVLCWPVMYGVMWHAC